MVERHLLSGQRPRQFVRIVPGLAEISKIEFSIFAQQHLVKWLALKLKSFLTAVKMVLCICS